MALATYLPFLSGVITPALGLQSITLHVGWALVLGAMSAFCLRPFPKMLRLVVVALVMLAGLLPGEWSPGWWLGLAFQAPSLTLQGIALLYLIRMWRLRDVSPVETVNSAAYARWPNSLLLMAICIGWMHALDTFAAFDVQLYALGFTPYAILALLLLAAVLRLFSLRSGDASDMQRHRDLAVIILGAMAIHVLTRLPTGNAWDALMDPWLWLCAQALWLSRAVVWLALAARVLAARLAEQLSLALNRRR